MLGLQMTMIGCVMYGVNYYHSFRGKEVITLLGLALAIGGCFVG